MRFATYEFKQRGAQALKGNWQTALVVSFFAGAPALICDLFQRISIPNLFPYLSIRLYQILGMTDLLVPQETALVAASIQGVPTATWVALGVLMVLSFLVTPALELGCNHYFVGRLRGLELGYLGLISRMRYFGKAFLLSLLMTIKILLWSLLFFVPGIIASIRYSMAPYYLAENPELSPWQALEKSKQAMRESKLFYFALIFSFMGWTLLVILIENMLYSMSPVVSLTVGQGLSLFVTAYMNSAVAAFFLAVSEPGGRGRVSMADNASEDSGEILDYDDDSQGDGF